MRVKLNTNMVCEHATGYVGDIVELPEAVAADLIKGGYAEQVSKAVPSLEGLDHVFEEENAGLPPELQAAIEEEPVQEVNPDEVPEVLKKKGKADK